MFVISDIHGGLQKRICYAPGSIMLEDNTLSAFSQTLVPSFEELNVFIPVC